MKTSKALMTALCTMMLCGCAKEEMNNNGTPDIKGDGSLLVYIDNGTAKTSLSIDETLKTGKIKWFPDDEMTINGTECSIKEILSEYDGTVAKLKDKEDKEMKLEEGTPYEAFYPSTLSNWVLPSVQTYAPDVNSEGNISGVYPMYGKGNVENDLICFHNILGLLQIRICSSNTEKDYTIKEIKVSDPNKGMCGAFTVTLTETLDKWTAVLTDNTNKIPVTLDCGEGVTVGTDHVTDFYVGIPAGEYNALTITVTDSEGNTREVVNNVSATVTRGNVYRLEFAYPFNFRKVGVQINNLIWATENLAVTESGKREFNHTGHVNGDYFQWGCYLDFCEPVSGADKGLLIYTSFTNTMCGGATDSWTFKGGRRFALDCAPPYYDGANYTKYNITDDLEQLGLFNDDAATVILADNWRIPTQTEFKDMRESTYWAWDDTDKGYYVFKPGQGTEGSAGGKGTIDVSDDKAQAVLFFPATGFATLEDQMINVGTFGDYWTSKVRLDDKTQACYVHYDGSAPDGGDIMLNDNFERFAGMSIRPVKSVSAE